MDPPPLYDLATLPTFEGRPSITIGNFDGVHLGHLEVVEALVGSAKRRGAAAVVLTFEPHPGRVLHPDRPLPAITTPAQKARLLRLAGVERTLFLRFTVELAQLEAEPFVEQVLVQALRAGEIVTTPTFRFGHDRGGDTATLEACGRRFGFSVELVGELDHGGPPISSTRIREQLRRGEVTAARELLGRPYSIEGRVVRGAGRGAALGFATANLETDNELFMARGVYAVQVRIGARAAYGLANVGVRPTFGEERLTVETHLLDFHEALLGQALELRFLERIRDEKRFAGARELSEQIRRDIETARRLFAAAALDARG